MKRKLYAILMTTILICSMLLGTACGTGSQVVSSEKDYVKRDTKLLSGSFLQSWICRDWTYDRWNQEFSSMKELGMDFMIIQSVTDQSYRLGTAEEQDWSSYIFKGQISLYPSKIEELEISVLSSQNNGDAIELMLKAAKENDMKVYIGLLSDDRWWDFGWGKPKLPEGKKDAATESYFASWCEYNGKLNGQMIAEIWDRY